MPLSGYHVCFSGFSDDNDDDNEKEKKKDDLVSPAMAENGVISKTWSLRAMRTLAESMGAIVQAHITRRTTVLVAQRGLTRKRLVADQHDIPVVSPRWLESRGRLSFADVKIAPLFGYTFCATQMTVDEEKALTTIIEQNGGNFDRTLTTSTSMLFVPPGWLKQWQQRQQQMRACGRSSTGPQGCEPLPALPEKIRFAWATDIPVVEYTRFLTMAALGTGVHVTDKAAAHADFDTIAQICALPVSVVNGAVPHTQWGAAPTEEDNKAKKKGEKKEFLLENTNTGHLIKRRRETDDDDDKVYHNNTGDDDQRRMKVRTEARDVVRDAYQGGRNNNDMQELPHGDSKLIVAAKPLTGDTAANTTTFSCRYTTVSPSGRVSNREKGETCESLFTHSRPFLQIALIGCTARELIDCIRMTVYCRFLRTLVVTPFTDVVVVGSEFGLDTFRNASAAGAVKVTPKSLIQQQQEQHRSQLLARLRDHLSINYGVPMERIVVVEWLRSCYQRMVLQQTPAVVHSTYPSFYPSPFPLSEIPSTENFYPCSPSIVLPFKAPSREKDEKEKPERKQHLIASSIRLRKKKFTDGLQQQQQEQQGKVKLHNASDAPKVLDTAQKQYEVELRLADCRVKDFLTLLEHTTEFVEGSCSPFVSSLFCFVDKEFSRIDLAVVRALIKHGKGKWLKKTRDVWIKALTRVGNFALGDENETQDGELMTLVRRQSVLHKRLYRMHTEDGEGEEVSTRSSINLDGRHSCKKFSPSSNREKPLVALYIVPHGDQRFADSLLRGEVRRSATSQRHPLRYLPVVTQDYVLCCLAARRLLHPGSCFLFSRPMPTEGERLTRRRSRNELGKPLPVSPWIGPRRHEKAPLIGVSTFFLCAMQEEASAAAVTLRRVLVNCLAAAVSELGGHSTETLLQETVTHIVVVDVASVFASELVVGAAIDDTLPLFKVEEAEEQEREELLTRNSKWPHALHDHLPLDLIEHVVKGQISLVGIEWLQASVAWGVFLDETTYSLDVVYSGHKQTRAIGGRDVVTFSAATPPLTPRRRTGFTDITLLPFEGTAQVIKSTGVSPSSQAGAGYQFDFTTPTTTPVRIHQPKSVLNDSNASTKRQSCPRSTLRTPQRQHLSLPRAFSPALALMNERINEEVQSVSGSSDTEEKRETATPLRISKATSDNNACTPVKEACIISSDEYVNDDDALCTQISYTRDSGKSMSLTPAIPQQWDPDAGNSNSCEQSRSTAHFFEPRNFESSSSLQWPLIAPILRIHIVHDAPDRKELEDSCLRLSDSVLRNSNNDDNSGSSHNGVGNSYSSFQQQHLQRPVNMAGVVIRVQLVGPSVLNADVLVTHQLTQRESVLAAIAAGLWVVTPKALQDCKERQCLLPLHDLSMYEWCPELLPSGASRSSLRLAKQCRKCRQRRQASGVRLFDGKVFVIVSPATSVALSRARSMRNILEIGGGIVVWVTCTNVDDDSAPHANTDATKVEDQEKVKMPATRSAVTPLSQPTSVSSPEMLLNFVLSKIRGQEEDCNNVDGDKRNDIGKCNFVPAKELTLLLEGFSQGNTTSGWLRDTVKTLHQAQISFAEAKREALERRQRLLHKHQPQLQPWGFSKVCNEVHGGNVQRNISSIWPSTEKPLHYASHASFARPLEDMKNKTGNIVNGMPFLEVVRVFTSEWVTLAIQQLKTTPLCVIQLPL